jgi:hypothetical protein
MPWCCSQTSSFIWDSTFNVFSCQCICMCNYKDFLLHLNYCWIMTMSSLLFWLTLSSLPLLLTLVISWDFICIQKYRLPIGYLKFHELESLLYFQFPGQLVQHWRMTSASSATLKVQKPQCRGGQTTPKGQLYPYLIWFDFLKKVFVLFFFLKFYYFQILLILKFLLFIFYFFILWHTSTLKNWYMSNR